MFRNVKDVSCFGQGLRYEYTKHRKSLIKRQANTYLLSNSKFGVYIYYTYYNYTGNEYFLLKFNSTFIILLGFFSF